jgi:RNA polymerase sigma-70 factor (ECF subfamily)
MNFSENAAQRKKFEEWVTAHAGILHHVVNGFAQISDRADLMQELLLAVWKAVPAFREESKVSTFLHRVTHNAALTWRRKNRNHDRRMEALRADQPPEFMDGSLSPADENREATADRLERLYSEIRRLPALDRSLILLSLDGLSYAEMAAIHGLTESNTGSRLTRARQKLAQALKAGCHADST